MERSAPNVPRCWSRHTLLCVGAATPAGLAALQAASCSRPTGCSTLSERRGARHIHCCSRWPCCCGGSYPCCAVAAHPSSASSHCPCCRSSGWQLTLRGGGFCVMSCRRGGGTCVGQGSKQATGRARSTNACASSRPARTPAFPLSPSLAPWLPDAAQCSVPAPTHHVPEAFLGLGGAVDVAVPRGLLPQLVAADCAPLGRGRQKARQACRHAVLTSEQHSWQRAGHSNRAAATGPQRVRRWLPPERRPPCCVWPQARRTVWLPTVPQLSRAS